MEEHKKQKEQLLALHRQQQQILEQQHKRGITNPVVPLAVVSFRDSRSPNVSHTGIATPDRQPHGDVTSGTGPPP
jgi:hypothetical protein